MIGGLIDFRKDFSGQIWLELMLVKDVNDSDRQLFIIRNAVHKIKPDKIFVMTPIRPPAEDWAECPKPERVRLAEKILSGSVTVKNREEGEFGVAEFKNAEEAILEISARHPLRFEQARAIEWEFSEKGILKQLLREHKIVVNRYRRTNYIAPDRKPERFESGAKPAAMVIAVERIKCCMYRIKLKIFEKENCYHVILDDAYYNNLAHGHLSKEELLQNCFGYFIDNAVIETLPSKIKLRDIGKQYPQFEDSMIKMIAGDSN